MTKLTLALGVAVFVLLGTSSKAAKPYAPGEPVRGNFKDFAQGFLENNCFDCHDEDTTKGDLNLVDLGPLDETNAAVWKSVWAQVALQEMPPKKKSQPDIVDRLRFSDWIVGELQRGMKDKGGFQAHLDPSKGNFVSHDLLFGSLPKGIQLAPTSSPACIWRVTPQEHITRLNELINLEPEYNPEKPGVRTRGDHVPTNHGGELKMYFGTDRITKWEGGTVAYATAVKSVPVVLSSARKHGLENYPDFYTVNSSEATQILVKAEDILRFMAYGPLSLVGFPEQITDDPKTWDKVKPKGDLRGLPTAIVYNTKVSRPITPVYDLMNKPSVTDDRLQAAVNYVFEAVTFRPPTKKESEDYLLIVKDSIDKVGKENGAFMGLSAIFLDRDALFRTELVESGKPDEHGRAMLQNWELGLAVNHALSYLRPDDTLRKAIVEGRMNTREDVKREVTRMMADDSIRKPRVLRFFRDFFDYDLGGYICKDNAALASTGVSARGTSHYRAMFDATASTDRLIELILQKDKNVLKELLTTQQVVATGTDKSYFGKKNSKEEREAAALARKKAAEESLKKESVALEDLEKEIEGLEVKLRDNSGDQVPPELLVNGSFSKVTFEEPDNWELEKGTLNQTELATGKVVAVRDMVTLEQTLSKPITSKTKLIVKATRTDSSSKGIRFTAIWDNGSHSANITPAIGQMELIVPNGKTMTGIQFNTYRANHGISEVSLREDTGILKTLTQKKKSLAAAKKKLEQEKKKKVGSVNVTQAELAGPRVYARVSRRSFGNGSMKPERTLSTVPEGQRLGLLTHPTWLVSHSDAMDNHAILRGRWIREKLLGGGIPDIPITVDAMLPDEPNTTLRERMRVTREKYCWTCHEKMDPLGLPFEMYNHAGLFRTTEQEKPVDTSGEILDSGDPALDGPVKDALEMIEKLAASERVEQVFVRHAFRFWMGRNETLNDAPVLQTAHKAYRESGGSMNALMTSLLTSDAFLYRKVEKKLAE
ncbi:MAG: DUF1588 domain-containing protein [Verrucomicrobia bacterium]|nr:DUF1588 domain-containing protein [Verrucomicrobiota bacterium]